MLMKDLIPLSREELRDLINKNVIKIDEDIDLDKDVDEYSFKLKLDLLNQLNKYYDKRAKIDFRKKLKKLTIFKLK